MSDEDNVRSFRMPPEAIVNAVLRWLDSQKPAAAIPLPDPELQLWDDVVRMRLSSMTYPAQGPARASTVDEAIDAANKIVAARREFAR
jgi:hypothetical protein